VAKEEKDPIIEKETATRGKRKRRLCRTKSEGWTQNSLHLLNIPCTHYTTTTTIIFLVLGNGRKRRRTTTILLL